MGGAGGQGMDENEDGLSSHEANHGHNWPVRFLALPQIQDDPGKERRRRPLSVRVPVADLYDLEAAERAEVDEFSRPRQDGQLGESVPVEHFFATDVLYLNVRRRVVVVIRVTRHFLCSLQ